MANICFNDITMVGDKAILQRLQDDIERHLNENDGSIIDMVMSFTLAVTMKDGSTMLEK